MGDDRRWQAVLGRLTDEFDALGCIIFDVADTGADRRLKAPYYSGVYDPKLMAHYLDHFNAEELAIQDKFARQLSVDDRPEICTDSFLSDSELAEMARPSIEWLHERGIKHRAATFLDKDNIARSRFSVQLHRSQRPFGADQIERISALLPHIAKALELGRPAAQLAAEHHGLIAAMDRLRIGMCILDQRGRLVISNEEFRRRCEAYDALRIDTRGRLQLHDRADRKRFAQLISDARAHGRFGARPRKEAILTSRDGQIGAICVEVAPLEKVEEMGTSSFGGAIVYTLDTQRPVRGEASVFQVAFGLTATEAQLINLIGEGLTNGEIAKRRSRSVETVNAQVKSILAKTQCVNRTQLVRLISSFAPGFLRHS